MNKGTKMKVTDYLFGESKVRVAGTAMAPLFATMDVCEVLGLKNPTVVMRALDEDEVTKLNLGGKAGETGFVTESGLYHLIFKSRKAAAKEFRRWVTQEVLPALRADGRYVVTAAPEPERSEVLTLPVWLEELEVDLVEQAWLVQRLVDRARVAAMQMGFEPGKARDDLDLVQFPRPVLDYAVGMVRHEAAQAPNAVWIDYFPKGFLNQGMKVLPGRTVR